jgi:periplasmic divalent cation tolerance protein
MKFVMLMFTAKDEKEARTISKSLLDKKLVACCNIIGGIRSMFWWEGKEEEIKESLVIAKTKRELAADAAKEIMALHSYKLPAIEFLEIKGGNSDYLKWIEESTIGQIKH